MVFNYGEVRLISSFSHWYTIYSYIKLFIFKVLNFFFKDKGVDTQTVLKQANSVLRKKYKIERTTIQVEYFVNSMLNCDSCKLPI